MGDFKIPENTKKGPTTDILQVRFQANLFNVRFNTRNFWRKIKRSLTGESPSISTCNPKVRLVVSSRSTFSKEKEQQKCKKKYMKKKQEPKHSFMWVCIFFKKSSKPQNKTKQKPSEVAAKGPFGNSARSNIWNGTI